MNVILRFEQPVHRFRQFRVLIEERLRASALQQHAKSSLEFAEHSKIRRL